MESPKLLEGQIVIDCLFAPAKSGARGNCPLPPSLNGNQICYNQLFYLQQNLDELTDTAIPADIRLNRAMDLEQPYSKFLS